MLKAIVFAAIIASMHPVAHKTHHRAFKPGQRQIYPDRVRQIQTALVNAGYYGGPVNGHWDPRTLQAMQKFQADNGWQTRLAPDARALIKLGLGPKPDGE